MFISIFIFGFLIWLLSSYFLFKISPFQNKIKLKKILYISTLFFIISLLILLISRNYSYLSDLEPVYIIGSILITIIVYSLFLTPISILSLIFLKNKKRILNKIFYLLIILPILMSIIGFLELRFGEKITYLNIATENQNLKGKKYVFFSDPQFSAGSQAWIAKKITHSLQKLSPEKIFIAGDIFNGEKLNWTPILKEMQNWNNIAPVFAVIGNHEYYGDYTEFIDLMNKANWSIISNETINLDGINILGLNYAFNENEKENIKSIVEEELKNKKIDIVISHEPLVYMAEKIAKYSTTFVFAGHTHNGQFWPLNYLVYLKYGKFIYGENIIGNSTFYTTSGYGISFIVNRLFNLPEMVVVKWK